MLDLPEELGDSDSDGSARLTAPGKHTQSAADQLKFAQTINNTLFEDPYSEKKSKKRSKDRRPPEGSPYDFKCKLIISIYNNSWFCPLRLALHCADSTNFGHDFEEQAD